LKLKLFDEYNLIRHMLFTIICYYNEMDVSTLCIILDNVESEYKKKETIFKYSSCVRGNDLPFILRKINSDSHKKDIIIHFGSSLTSNNIMDCLQLISSDSHKKNIIIHFANILSYKDIPKCLILLKSDSNRLNIVKELYNKNGQITMEEVLELIKTFESNLGIKIAKFFNKWFVNENDVLRAVENIAQNPSVPISAPINELMTRMMELNYLKYPIKNHDLTSSEKCKIAMVNEIVFHSTNLFVIGESLNKLLSMFETDKNKMDIIQNRIDTGQFVDPNFTCLKYISDEKYKINALITIIEKNGNDIDRKTLVPVMKMFSTKYRAIVSHKLVGKIPVLSQEVIIDAMQALESKQKAMKFVQSVNIEIDVNCALESAGYVLTPEEEYDSANDSESDIELEISNEELNTQLIPVSCMGQSHMYDPRLDSIDFQGIYIINNINVGDELLKEGRKKYKKMKKKEKKSKEKKNALRIPHSWKDMETNEETEYCIICIKRKKCIAFNCGHISTCCHCSRKIIRQSKQCPQCRNEISSVMKVYL